MKSVGMKNTQVEQCRSILPTAYCTPEVAQSLGLLLKSVAQIVEYDAAALFINKCFLASPERSPALTQHHPSADSLATAGAANGSGLATFGAVKALNGMLSPAPTSEGGLFSSGTDGESPASTNELSTNQLSTNELSTNELPTSDLSTNKLLPTELLAGEPEDPCKKSWLLFWEQNLVDQNAERDLEPQHRGSTPEGTGSQSPEADISSQDQHILSIPIADLLDSPTLQYAPSGTRSALTIPIRKQGTTVAMLVLYKGVEHYFDAQHISQLDAYKLLICAVLEHAARALKSSIHGLPSSPQPFSQDPVQAADQQLAIASISRALKNVEQPDDLAVVFMSEVLRLTDGLTTTIYRANHTAQTFDFWQSYPTNSFRPGDNLSHAMNSDLLGIATQGRAPLLFHWEETDAGRKISPKEAKQLGIQYGAVFLPMVSNQDKLVGIMIVHLDENQQLLPQTLVTLQAVATMAADVLNRASTMVTLEELVAERTHELRSANERLRELDNLKNKFIQDMSHEFRTPLTSIGLYLSLLEKETTDDAQPNRYIDALKRQTNQLSSLVDGILDIANPDRVSGIGACEDVDLELLVEELINTKRPYAEANGIELRGTLPEGIMTFGNRSALQRMVSNLIDNAINYTLDGSVEVGLSSRGDQLCILVKDTGMGIPEEDLAHIFERFYRGTGASQSDIPGSGLGLSMVKQIAEQHSGHVSVESVEGKGTEFRVWLPCVEEPNPASISISA